MCGVQLGLKYWGHQWAVRILWSVSQRSDWRKNRNCVAMRMAVVASVRRAAVPPFLESRATHPVKGVC